MHRINVGCSISPTAGWLNFDNSFSIKLSSYPALARILYQAKLIKPPQMELIKFFQENKVIWADAAKRIPLQNNSVETLYSSHMIEHLDRIEAKLFLEEANRVLVPGGIIRLAVPDIEKLVKKYLEDGDADVFIESTVMCIPKPRGMAERIQTFLVGPRHHQWMYDTRSLCKLLTETGFTNPTGLNAGQTRIANHHPLNLYERESESIYVEATKPAG
jgi:predicted SAM-dependent methyltransferase